MDEKNSTRLYRFQERFSEFDAHTSCQFTVLKQFLTVFPLYTVLEIAVISIPRFLHFRPIIFPLFLYLHYPSTAYRLVTVLIFGSLPALPSFLPCASRTNSRIHTHTHTHEYTSVFKGVYDVGSRHRPYEFARSRGTGRKEISQRANRCLKRAVEDLPVSTELSLPSSFVRLYLFSIPLLSSLLSFLPFLSLLPTLFLSFFFLPIIIVAII